MPYPCYLVLILCRRWRPYAVPPSNWWYHACLDSYARLLRLREMATCFDYNNSPPAILRTLLHNLPSRTKQAPTLHSQTYSTLHCQAGFALLPVLRSYYIIFFTVDGSTPPPAGAATATATATARNSMSIARNTFGPDEVCTNPAAIRRSQNSGRGISTPFNHHRGTD